MIGAEIIPELNDSTTRLFRKIGRFSSRDFNTRMPGDQWNAGQIAEHIFLTDLYIFRLLQRAGEFAGRQPDEKVVLIKDFFQGTDRKQQTPDYSIPSDSMKDPFAIQEKISRERHSIIQFLSSVEEDFICSAFAYPGLGTLTVSEWVWFIVYHTDRHTAELAKMEVE